MQSKVYMCDNQQLEAVRASKTVWAGKFRRRHPRKLPCIHLFMATIITQVQSEQRAGLGGDSWEVKMEDSP